MDEIKERKKERNSWMKLKKERKKERIKAWR